ncbi:hypothetical protein U1Q18_050302 [Sarracenia purpurea var. burkii]
MSRRDSSSSEARAINQITELMENHPNSRLELERFIVLMKTSKLQVALEPNNRPDKCGKINAYRLFNEHVLLDKLRDQISDGLHFDYLDHGLPSSLVEAQQRTMRIYKGVMNAAITQHGSVPAFCGEHSMLTRNLLEEAGFNNKNFMVFSFVAEKNHALVLYSYPYNDLLECFSEDFSSFGHRLNETCKKTAVYIPYSGQPSPMVVIFDFWSENNKVVELTRINPEKPPSEVLREHLREAEVITDKNATCTVSAYNIFMCFRDLPSYRERMDSVSVWLSDYNKRIASPPPPPTPEHILRDPVLIQEYYRLKNEHEATEAHVQKINRVEIRESLPDLELRDKMENCDLLKAEPMNVDVPAIPQKTPYELLLDDTKYPRTPLQVIKATPFDWIIGQSKEIVRLAIEDPEKAVDLWTPEFSSYLAHGVQLGVREFGQMALSLTKYFVDKRVLLPMTAIYRLMPNKPGEEERFVSLALFGAHWQSQELREFCKMMISYINKNSIPKEKETVLDELKRRLSFKQSKYIFDDVKLRAPDLSLKNIMKIQSSKPSRAIKTILSEYGKELDCEKFCELNAKDRKQSETDTCTPDYFDLASLLEEMPRIENICRGMVNEAGRELSERQRIGVICDKTRRVNDEKERLKAELKKISVREFALGCLERYALVNLVAMERKNCLIEIHEENRRYQSEATSMRSTNFFEYTYDSPCFVSPSTSQQSSSTRSVSKVFEPVAGTSRMDSQREAPTTLTPTPAQSSSLVPTHSTPAVRSSTSSATASFSSLESRPGPANQRSPHQ